VPQITLYVDDDTRKLVERAAKSSGLSQSRWVAEAIRKQAAQSWPPSFLKLAGSFPDFPLREEGEPLPEDRPRISW
jgi:hypothetical protein